MAKGWSQKTPACIECLGSDEHRADVAGLCKGCKSFQNRGWPKWLAACTRCDRPRETSLYCKKGLCRRCAVDLGVKFRRGKDIVPDEVQVWFELFEDSKEASRNKGDKKDRLAMSVIKVMGVGAAAQFLEVRESMLRHWVWNGIPVERRKLVIQKRMGMHGYRPTYDDDPSLDEVAGRKLGGPMDSF